jgi:broad specificity phosphatase PhoE
MGLAAGGMPSARGDRVARVLLIRHGRTSHVHEGGLLDRAGIERWRRACDLAGLAEGDAPSPHLAAEVAQAEVLAASDMPRAVTSVAALAPGRTFTVSTLLREVPLPIPPVPIRAPLAVWNALIHLRWGIDILRGCDASREARSQAEAAATWCVVAARQARSGTIAVVTHGVFRRLLARQLLAEGWRFEPGPRSYGHWSTWRLRATREVAFDRARREAVGLAARPDYS